MLHTIILPRLEIKAGDGRSGRSAIWSRARGSLNRRVRPRATDRPGYCCKLFRDRVISGATAALSITNNDSAIV